MPWHKASEEDINYVRHVRHPHYLRQVLPISLEANFILQRIFHPCSEYAPSLEDIRLMVNATKSFFMDDKEIRRSRRLQYISDKFAAMRRYVEAAMDSDSHPSMPLPHVSVPRSHGLHSQSIAAMEEGRLKPDGTPVPKPFVHGMMRVPEFLPSSLLPPRISGKEKAPPAIPLHPPLTEMKNVNAPVNGTSSTLFTSKDYGHKLSRTTRRLFRLSRSVRTLFRGIRTE